MKFNYYLLVLAPAIFLIACAHKNVYTVTSRADSGNRPTTNVTSNVTRKVENLELIKPANSERQSMMPKAIAFKMSGDYADNVAITIGGDGQLLYYPAPSDISEYSKPIDLGDGWWLNRQGIGRNSVFTRYTFEEYSSLAKVPTQQELKEAVIPGAKVTAITELPFTIGEAANHLTEVKEYLKNL